MLRNSRWLGQSAAIQSLNLKFLALRQARSASRALALMVVGSRLGCGRPTHCPAQRGAARSDTAGDTV